MQSKAEGNRVLSSLWSARIIPWVLTGVVGYATYVLVALLSVNYLLIKHDSHHAAIPILVIYFVLFTLMASSFFRLVYVTIVDPPYVPLGPSAPPARRDRISYKSKSSAKHTKDGIAMGEYDARDTSGEAKAQNDPDSPGLERFYTKDVFTCELDGRPRWCSSCANWKPDRAHHCSSSGRCIIKMDHFCPWIGGPIGENNFKYFLQFNFYAALYCAHLLVVMAIYVRKQIGTEGENVNHHFAAILALAGLFGIFTGSMFGTCTYLAISNLTQVEQLGSKTKSYRLAVLKPSSAALHGVNPSADSLSAYHEITYPLDHSQYQYPEIQRYQTNTPAASYTSHPNQKTFDGSTISPASDTCHGPPNTENLILGVSSSTPEYRGDSSPGAKDLNAVRPVQPDSSAKPPQDANSDNTRIRAERVSTRDMMATRTFAIVEMKTGENPWDLGSPLLNIQTLMGTSLIDYLLPIRRSPCCYHEDPESYYDLGPAVDRVKVSYNLMDAGDIRTSGRPKHSKGGVKASPLRS